MNIIKKIVRANFGSMVTIPLIFIFFFKLTFHQVDHTKEIIILYKGFVYLSYLTLILVAAYLLWGVMLIIGHKLIPIIIRKSKRYVFNRYLLLTLILCLTFCIIAINIGGEFSISFKLLFDLAVAGIASIIIYFINVTIPVNLSRKKYKPIATAMMWNIVAFNRAFCKSMEQESSIKFKKLYPHPEELSTYFLEPRQSETDWVQKIRFLVKHSEENWGRISNFIESYPDLKPMYQLHLLNPLYMLVASGKIDYYQSGTPLTYLIDMEHMNKYFMYVENVEYWLQINDRSYAEVNLMINRLLC